MNNNEKIKNKAGKKALLIAISVIAGLIVCLSICSALIDAFEARRAAAQKIDFDFYPADYEENIFEDEDYLELIEGEYMSFCDITTNLTVGIDREGAIDYGKEVAFLVEMLHDAISGDHTAYNACFSNEYYKNNQPKSSFTMQKIYDIVITYISRETLTDSDGNNYTKSIYTVEYKIYKNNGTFRNDIGNGSKKQYFTLTDTTGLVLVDNISTVNPKR